MELIQTHTVRKAELFSCKTTVINIATWFVLTSSIIKILTPNPKSELWILINMVTLVLMIKNHFSLAKDYSNIVQDCCKLECVFIAIVIHKVWFLMLWSPISSSSEPNICEMASIIKQLVWSCCHGVYTYVSDQNEKDGIKCH